jgi:uncharacterized membrane protein
MLYYTKLYLVTFFAFLAIDMIWLGLVARPFYQKYLGFLMAPKPNWLAAIIFYLLFIAGILLFVVVPGLKMDSFKITLLYGMFFGLITYATYDLTNLATISNWPLLVTVVDIIWGMVLSMSVSAISFLAGKWLS